MGPLGGWPGRMVARVGAVVLVSGMLAAPAGAATLTVNTTGDSTTSGDGLCSLREAIFAADGAPTSNDCGATDAAGNTIVLPASAAPYTLAIPNSGADLQAVGDLDITGSAPLVISGAGAGAGQTTIDASGLHDRIVHVFSGATVTITGLSLTGGNALDGTDGTGAGDNPPNHDNPSTAGVAGADGGAILNQGTLSLSDVALTLNSAGDGGTGGHASGANGGATASPGGAGGVGGAIANDGTLTVEGATFSANRAGTGGQGGHGVGGGAPEPGAIGGAGGDGGAIENAGGNVTVQASLFTGNDAGRGGLGGSGDDSIGQGFSAAGGGPGQRGGDGGAIASIGGNLSVQNSTLTQNAGGAGGNGTNAGADHQNDPPTPTNGSNGGDGGAGGAIFLGGGNVIVLGTDHNTLDSTTITGNRSGAPGPPGSATGAGTAGHAGAAANASGVAAKSPFSVTLTNTLLSANETSNCSGGVRGDASDLSFGDSTCPGTFLAGDPKLGAVRDNGGPTETIAPGTGSAGIDAAPSCPATDQRGVTRPAGAACDIGAYELAAPTVATSAADAITTSGATLHGSVNPDQATASAHFEYGTTTAYGESTAEQTANGVGEVALSPAQLTGLQPGTTYHFRLVASSDDGSSASSDATFTTTATPAGTGTGGTGGTRAAQGPAGPARAGPVGPGTAPAAPAPAAPAARARGPAAPAAPAARARGPAAGRAAAVTPSRTGRRSPT